MEQRARFVLEALRGYFTMSELCYRYGVSRKTGYKWIERYHQVGTAGCGDQPRTPRNHPNATDPKLEARIVKLRAPRSTWRPARTAADQPNRVWTADFKGQFRLGNGVLCYPLTILDAYSRFLIVCRALKGTALLPARRAFEAAFREYGLPDVIRTDNGVPFCAPGSILGLSTLSVWFLKLGIALERSRPGKPQDNGAHERMHRTLKQQVALPPRGNEAAQQRSLNRFRRIYNDERPHHALQMKTPASCYVHSTRPFPEDLPDPVYPGHFELRRVTKIGVFTWKQHQIFLTEALRNETLGLEHIAAGLWSVFFGDVLLGRFSEVEYRFVPGMGR